MHFILEKLREDFASNNTKLWVHGFVDALMALLQQNPGLNLPADLSRVRVKENCLFVQGKTFLISPVHESIAADAILDRQKLTGKKLLFFLDEFAPNPETKLDQDMLAFFREICST
jgi:hypothetical protein